MAKNAYDNYITHREWLIDTAETPTDKKNLKADLAALDAKFYKNRLSNLQKPSKRTTAGVKTTSKTVNKLYRPTGK